MMSFSPTRTTLFVVHDHCESERLQLVNYLKGNLCDVRATEGNLPLEILEIDADAIPPFLIDKGLYLNTSHRLDAFFEERFPGTPLLPTDAIPRAKVRTLADRIRSWYDFVETENYPALTDKINEFGSVLDPDTRWFTGDMMTFIDVAAAPLLNRAIELELPLLNTTLLRYQQRICSFLNAALNPYPGEAQRHAA